MPALVMPLRFMQRLQETRAGLGTAQRHPTAKNRHTFLSTSRHRINATQRNQRFQMSDETLPETPVSDVHRLYPIQKAYVSFRKFFEVCSRDIFR